MCSSINEFWLPNNLVLVSFSGGFKIKMLIKKCRNYALQVQHLYYRIVLSYFKTNVVKYKIMYTCFLPDDKLGLLVDSLFASTQ